MKVDKTLLEEQLEFIKHFMRHQEKENPKGPGNWQLKELKDAVYRKYGCKATEFHGLLNELEQRKEIVSEEYFDHGVKKRYKLSPRETVLQGIMSPKMVFNAAPVLHGSALVIMDCQIPYHDGEFMLKLLELAQLWGIKQGVSGGDFFNQAAWF